MGMEKGNQPGGLPSAPAGQPGITSEAAPVPVARPKPEQQGGAATPQLTEDAALAFFQKAVAEGKIDLTPQFEKVIQSRNDRLTNQIKKIIDTAKADGIDLTEAQAAKIAALTPAPNQPQPQPAPMTAAPSPAAPAQAPAGGVASDPAMAIAELWMNEDGKTAEDRSVPSTVEAYRLMAAAGTRLTADDAELKGIVVDKGQVAYLDSVKTAIAAKQARVAAQGNPGRIPAMGGGAPSTQPAHAGLNGMQTLTMAMEEQLRGGLK